MIEDALLRQAGLRRIINVAGTMTALGSSIMNRDAIAAAAAIAPHFVEIDDLQRQASASIAAATGAEAGFVTACSSAAITLAIAGAMTGVDRAAIERLPDTSGLRNEVVVQCGHLVNYGAPLDQAIRLAGAKVVPVGQATAAAAYQLEAALGERTAAALYVVSHHAVHYGQLPLATFIHVCRTRGVPVIVDAASEYDLRGFVAAGADVAIYSGHKFLGGPTSGILAGREALVRAAYLQNRGIGRGMKIGKEGIFGLLAALAAWQGRDHAATAAAERETLELWAGVFAGTPGISAAIVDDPTGNPLQRLRLEIDAKRAGVTAWDLAARLAAGEPGVFVRREQLELGLIELDPANLHPGEAHIVAERLGEELARARKPDAPAHSSFAAYRMAEEAAALCWPRHNDEG